MIHGPEPIICLAGSNPPADSVGTIWRRFVSARMSRNAAFGAFSEKTTVEASGYSTLSTNASWVRLVFLSSVARPQEYLTSSVVMARPLTGAMLWNFTPGRSLIVHFRPSGLASALAAASPVGNTLAAATFGSVLYL